MKWLKIGVMTMVLLAVGGMKCGAAPAKAARVATERAAKSALGTWLLVMNVPNPGGSGSSPVVLPIPLRFVNQGGGAFAIDMGVIVPGGYGVDLGSFVTFGFATAGGPPIDPVFYGVNRGTFMAGIYQQSYYPPTTSTWFAFRVN